MSNLQINNTNSFSFGEDYNATHEKNDEFSDIQDPTAPPMAILQDNPFNPQVNPFVQPVDENNQQINIFEPPANAQFVIETQPNKANSQPVNKNVLLNNTNAQPANMNAQQNKSNNHPKNTNAQPKNKNAQPNNMNAQPNNMNAQLDNTELDLAIIFKSLSQVMQQYLTEKSLQKSESGQNQINNEPLQGLKNILMNQLFRLYSSPKQNRPAKNKLKVQESQFSNNLKKDQIQNNQKENNNNDSFNQSEESSIHDEININLKELININKLTNLIMLISYEDQKKNQDLMLKELVKSNKAQKTMLEELIKSNKNQEKINNILFNSIEKALAFINDNNKKNTNNSILEKNA